MDAKAYRWLINELDKWRVPVDLLELHKRGPAVFDALVEIVEQGQLSIRQRKNALWALSDLCMRRGAFLERNTLLERLAKTLIVGNEQELREVAARVLVHQFSLQEYHVDLRPLLSAEELKSLLERAEALGLSDEARDHVWQFFNRATARRRFYIRHASVADGVILEDIRRAAFEPVFASFRALLGEEIYELAQAKQDAVQADMLRGLIAPDSGWDVFVAEVNLRVVGFVAVRVDPETFIGEIGLNAVHPDHAGHGVGTSLYEYALGHMKRAGARVATVATGGDASHAAARRAFEKAGFHAAIPSVWLCRLL
ncbi:GNAT family N-acetyltransferase [Corallococcus sp. CA049B]|uniref:GNAT family N-acetyltransferase n=1 Tax=Corallococcus sp. CA049B TaxID=2316730 RepID=UPI001F3DB2B1|nr:GNAT family N-acetyltransferase [Corallococcus sp. CA049B]